MSVSFTPNLTKKQITTKLKGFYFIMVLLEETNFKKRLFFTYVHLKSEFREHFFLKNKKSLVIYTYLILFQ